MIKVTSKGDFSKSMSFLQKAAHLRKKLALDVFGRRGVDALKQATPVDSGKTADSWSYEISEKDGNFAIIWTNSNVNNGVNIALLLQYDHATGSGGYIRGIDYINPAIKPVFDKIADDAWKEVTS